MKLVRQNQRCRHYQLRPVDAQLFTAVLGHFPCLQRGHLRASLTGDGPAIEEAEALLAAATEERTRKHRSELDEWLQAADRFKTVGQHLELRVELRRIEWLLQILNDVRLGMWVKLGSPKDLEVAARDAAPEQMLPLVLMDAAGMFQMVLLGDAIS